MMDDFMDFAFNAEEMFAEQYGDISFSEPPDIEQNDDSEELMSQSYSSPFSQNSENNEKFDELILDKEEDVSEIKVSYGKSVSEEKGTEEEPEEIKEGNNDWGFLNSGDDTSDKDVVKESEKEPEAEPEPVKKPSQSFEKKAEKKQEKKQEEEPKVSEKVHEKEQESASYEYNKGYGNNMNDDVEVIYSEPYDDPYDNDYESFNILPFVKKFSKLIACVAMILVVIGIPILFSSISHSSHSSGKKVSADKPAKKVTVTTESHISLDKALIESNGFEEAKEAAYSSMKETNESSRFKNLDELSFYLNSNMASTLALEKALATQYENGKVSRDYYYSQLSVHREFADELNHLLTINKTTYQNENMEDEYNTLVNDMDALILYGDTLYYGGTEKSL